MKIKVNIVTIVVLIFLFGCKKQSSPPPIQTTTIQPDHSSTETMIAVTGGVNSGDNTAPEFGGVAWTVGGAPDYVRGLFKFDISGIPSNSKIIAAKLTLYSDPTPKNGNATDANYGADNTILLDRITTAWDWTVSWQAQPSIELLNEVIIPHTNLSKLDLVDIDVTEMFKRMVSVNNFGFMIKLKNEVAYTSRIFCSSKYLDITKHPKLVVTYQ